MGENGVFADFRRGAAALTTAGGVPAPENTVVFMPAKARW